MVAAAQFDAMASLYDKAYRRVKSNTSWSKVRITEITSGGAVSSVSVAKV